MTVAGIPLIILGGSDRKPATLPPTGKGEHPISGCKGVDVRIGDRHLIEVLVERLEACGSFGPLYIAGPSSVYEGIGLSVPVIDTDGGFGRNIQVGLEAVLGIHPRGPVAITTCDILPAVGELRQLLEDFHANAPSHLWFPLIRAPRDPEALGPSAWKPQYFIVPRQGEPAVRVLPGHLTVFDPQALRLRFLYRVFDLGYRTRNRPILVRRSYMLQKLFLTLLYRDLRHILNLRLPTFTWDVVRSGIAASRKLKDGVITRVELEGTMRQMFVRRRHRKRYPERRVLVPLMEGLSLARDIDTKEEAAALGATAV